MEENNAQEQYQPIGGESRRLNVKKIISLTIGAVVIIIVLVLVLTFIFPRFFSKTPQEISLVYWGIWEDDNSFNELAQEFTRQNPNIKIKYEKQDIKALGKYIDRLATRIENGTGPDMFRYHNSWIPQLVPLLLPMPSDIVSATELESKFYPVVEDDLKIKGAYYGIPIHFDTLALFVNNQIFSAAGIQNFPTTWDDLTSVARQLTVKDGDGKIITAGVALGTFDNIAHSSDIISLLLLQNGADIKDLNGPARQNAFDALSFYTSFANGDSKVWDGTLENSKLAFARGRLALYFGYSWDILEIKALNPNLEFSVLAVPHLPGRNITIASYWVEGVSAKTKHAPEAFKFLKFLASRETLEKRYAQHSKIRLFGELYPRNDMADLLSSNTLIYPFVAQGNDAKSTIFSSDTYDEAMVDSLNSYLGNAVRSVINDNTSVQTAVETLTNGASQVLGRYEGNTN